MNCAIRRVCLCSHVGAKLFPATATASCRTASSHVHTLADVSPRAFAELEDQIWRNVASKANDPILQKDLGTLKWTGKRIESDGDRLKLVLRLPTLLHPKVKELKRIVKDIAARELSLWTSKHGIDLNAEITVNVVAPVLPTMARFVENHDELLKQLGPGLVNVSQYLAVYSCKGGVGKSTIAVNLAYELARLGGRVGLLDIDIYGPSLPILVKPADPAVRPSPLGNGMVYPIFHEGVKLLSLGYVSPKSGVPGSGPDAGAAVMRGPMAGKVVQQLLKATDWGELDLLILDLPPGTGDVQLAVCQELQLSAAVAVTTPSKLASEDTRKGIEMFTSLGVPTIAVVENMSYFTCEGGSRHYPFGRGLEGLSKPGEGEVLVDSSNIVRLPISTATNDANDGGAPLSLTRREDAVEELNAFEELAEIVTQELLLQRYRVSEMLGTITIDGVDFEVESVNCSIGKGKDNFQVRLFSDISAKQVQIPASQVRGRDPKSGEFLSNYVSVEGSKPEDEIVSVHKSGESKNPAYTPTRVEQKGRYGFAVEWGDGATIIYSMQTIARAAKHVAELQK